MNKNIACFLPYRSDTQSDNNISELQACLQTGHIFLLKGHLSTPAELVLPLELGYLALERMCDYLDNPQCGMVYARSLLTSCTM